MEAKASEITYYRNISTEDGDVPFLRDIWGFFGSKGIKTQFLTINSSKSFKVDIEICESLGCPIRILTDSEETEKRWAIIQSTLKNRKLADEDKEKTWLQGIEKKWILPKNIIVKRCELNWNTIQNEVKSLQENRCDLLKIEGSKDEERVLLYSMLDSGFRPGILLVRYTEDPDANVPSMLVAGHLQMSGYKLVENVNNWFLYLYTDICVYDSCSWRNTKVQNPVVQYIAELFTQQKKPQPAVPSQESNTEEKSKNE